MNRDSSIKVWDAPVRAFHWLLVGDFVALYGSGEVAGFDPVHGPAGYVMLALLVFRLVWGFIGGEYARFSSFLYSPREIAAHVRGMIAGRPAHFLGHSPAGSVYVFLILSLLTLTAATGLIVQGYFEFEGPLFALGIDPPRGLAHLCLKAHHWLVDGMLVLIAGHLAGVFLASWQHRENLVRAMITGRKPLHP